MRREFVMSSSGFASSTMKSARLPPSGVPNRPVRGGRPERLRSPSRWRPSGATRPPPSAPARGAPRSRRSDPAPRSPNRERAMPRPRGASRGWPPSARRSVVRPAPPLPRRGSRSSRSRGPSTSGATVSARMGAPSHGGGVVCRPRSEMPMFGITKTSCSTMAAMSASSISRSRTRWAKPSTPARHQLLGVIVVEDVGYHVEAVTMRLVDDRPVERRLELLEPNRCGRPPRS